MSTANNNFQVGLIINKLQLIYLNKNHNKVIIALKKTTIIDQSVKLKEQGLNNLNKALKFSK